jgi:hypothetical protein
MGTRMLRALRHPLDPMVVDWALAAIFIAIAQWEIWVTGLGSVNQQLRGLIM